MDNAAQTYNPVIVGSDCLTVSLMTMFIKEWNPWSSRLQRKKEREGRKKNGGNLERGRFKKDEEQKNLPSGLLDPEAPRRKMEVEIWLNRAKNGAIFFDSPVVELEPGPPVGRPEQGLERARQVHEAVAHQEEHGQQGSDLVNVACQDH